MIMTEPLHFTGVRGKLSRDEPLARHTAWRCGGDIGYRLGRESFWHMGGPI